MGRVNRRVNISERAFPVLSILLVICAICAAVFLVRKALILSPEDKTAAPVLAAGIAVTGVLTTAGVTLVGYLLRQSIDRRTTKLAEEANRRAAADSALETVKLLATADGHPAPAVQASAALIVLASLGQLSLALDLAAELWPNDQLTARAGSSLCDEAFGHGDAQQQRSAAVLLLNNWERLESVSGQAQWPSSLRAWPDGMSPDTRG